MPVCMGLLSGPLDRKVMEHWFTTDLFAEHILHVHRLENVDPAGGNLSADPFCIPDEIDVRDIAGLVIFDCETSVVDVKYGFQVPALGISCLDDRNIICPRGWCDEAPYVEEYVSDCSILDDPCALYDELRCCLFKLVKDAEKVSISFKGRSVTFAPKSEQDKARLERMMLEAKSECDACTGQQSGTRGGFLGHSCTPRYRPRRGCC